MRGQALAIALVIGGGAIVANGQVTVHDLITNTMKLDVRVTLDRATYFPGERASIGLSVRNPTSAPLLVLQPFTASTGLINLGKKSGADYEIVGESNHRLLPRVPPTTVLEPGQELTANLDSAVPSVFGLGLPVMGSLGAPSRAGEYALAYTYSGYALGLFTVVAPMLEASTVIRVPDEPYTNSVTHQTKQLLRYMHVFALRWDHVSYLCATIRPNSIDPPSSRDPDTEVFDSGAVVPYKRLPGATSALPIISVTGTADTNGNLNVVWRDSGGTDHNLYIPKQ
jgi:hypothetical protein